MIYKQLELTTINLGDGQDAELVNIIKGWNGNILVLKEGNFKIMDNDFYNTKIFHQSRVLEIENDFISRTYTTVIKDQVIRLVFAGEGAAKILNLTGKPQPFTIASILPTGFAVHFTLKNGE